ncbi:MAG: hypothetical protein ACOYOO_07575 [Saprospiraceae bacterium]|jgi:hypothetical protein
MLQRHIWPIVLSSLLVASFQARPAFAQSEYDIFLIKAVVPFGEAGFVAVFLDHPERPKQLRMEFFAPDNRSLAQRVVSLERRGVEAKFEGVFAWNGRLQVLTSIYYPGPQRNYLMLQQYEIPDFGEVAGVVVDEAYTPQLYRVPFGYALSPDRTKAMFYSWSYSLPGDPARLTVTVLEENLDTLWQQRYVLPYKNASLYLYDCRLTDDGRAFLLGENYTGKVGPVIDENKIDYFVLCAVPGEENMIIYDINPAGYALRGLHIDPAEGNAMAGAAFYQEPGKEVHLGVFAFYIPPGGEKMVQGIVPVDKERYQAAFIYPQGDDLLNANRHRFESYQVRKVKLLEDGSLLAIAEQEYYSATEGIYEFNDMLAFRLQPDLQRLQWFHRLPKRQTEGFNRNPLSPFSFKVFYRENKVYLMYNDLVAHHQPVGKFRTFGRYRGEDGAVILAELEAISGKVRFFNLSKMLQPHAIQKAWISHCWDLDGRELLIFGGSDVLGESKLLGLDWKSIIQKPYREF